MDQLLWIAVLLNAGATITLWQRAARRPEKLKKKFRKRFWNGKPITPKHEPPPPLKADTYGVGKEVLQFFSDFEDFAEVINWWLADPDAYPHGKPWRLQELPKSELLALGYFGPTYGRTYAAVTGLTCLPFFFRVDGTTIVRILIIKTPAAKVNIWQRIGVRCPCCQEQHSNSG